MASWAAVRTPVWGFSARRTDRDFSVQKLAVPGWHYGYCPDYSCSILGVVKITGNLIYDVIGSVIIDNLLGSVAIFLGYVNRGCLIDRDNDDLDKILYFLKNDPVVDSIHDFKSEVIGPGLFRFMAEIEFRKATRKKDASTSLKPMADYDTHCILFKYCVKSQ